jgi:hypothetical protein
LKGILAIILAATTIRKEFLQLLLRQKRFARNSCNCSCGKSDSQGILAIALAAKTIRKELLQLLLRQK